MPAPRKSGDRNIFSSKQYLDLIKLCTFGITQLQLSKGRLSLGF
uniref:Uncharacterized protein n=1 Tax=Anguilla anguilla TaxID=7936 RepID=A0A0E9UR35_ANGAN